MGAQAVQAPARWPAEALLMSSLETRTDRFFSVWLITGFLLYAFGFFLAPSSKAQYLTLYIGLILPALYFSFFHFKQYYLENNRALLWILFITIALYLPSAWADGDTLDTLRKNLKGVLFVVCLSIAIRHTYLTSPRIIERLPFALLGCGALALALFYINLAQSGVVGGGVSGMGNLGENPNETGLALSVSLIILAASMARKPSPAGILLFVAFLIAIYLAYSRAALLGLAVTLPFMLFHQYGKPRAATAFLVCCSAGAITVAGMMLMGELDADELLSQRPSLWMDFLSHNPGFNWAWGAGLPGSITIFSDILQRKLEPHSLYFALGLRGGILAITLFLGLVLAAVIRHGIKPSSNSVWLYILMFGMITQCFEGVYPVRPPNSFWLYTWLPLFMLLLTTNKNPDR